jgi:hypothetical protein
MCDFSNFILKIISEYKALLRRHFTAQEVTKKIRRLKLNRMCIRDTNNLSLFYIGEKIIKDLEKYVATRYENRTSSTSFYFGAEEFLKHFKRGMAEYCVADDSVIHTKKAASCAMVEAIQLLDTPESEMNMEVCTKLDRCLGLVVEHGTPEVVEFVKKTIRSNKRSIERFIKRCGKNFQIIENLIHDE